MTFAMLNLIDPLLKAVQEKGYTTPSPIQLKSIPAIMERHDIMATAQTGTGKTAGFVLPIIQRLVQNPRPKRPHPRVLVLAPTRELAAQVEQSIYDYGKYCDIRSLVVTGGVSINPQISGLRKGVDILVATPGRLLDLHEQKAVSFAEIEILVLDEADRMLDMGFIHDIKRVMRLMPRQRQNLLFSATFSSEIRELAKGLLHNPVEINVAPKNTTATLVKQIVYPVDKGRKVELLSSLIRKNDWSQVLVFCRTKHGADKVVKQLFRDQIHAQAIHGNKSQNHRTKTLAQFKTNDIRVLVATDIAARGIDIAQLPHVINFDLPDVAEDYVHRIGRTGRAGCLGEAISLVSADEFKQLQAIERLIKMKLEREEIEGFEPCHNLPFSRPASTHAPVRKAQAHHKKPTTTHARKSVEHNRRTSKPGHQRRGKANVITG